LATEGTRSTRHVCRPCRSAYGKEHYAANRQRYIDQAQVVKQRLRLERTTYLIEFFEKHSCADRGESDPVVLEFDHLGDKRFSIGSKLCTATWNDILAEIESASSCARTATDGARPNVWGQYARL